MRYFVYENYPNNRARVHVDICSFSKSEACRLANGQWYGSYDEREDAFAKARETGRANVDGCGHCNP